MPVTARASTPTLGSSPNGAVWASAAVLLLSFALLYRHVLAKLVHDWGADENYSHGFLVIPLALYFAWERRARLAALPRQPSSAGLLLIVGSVTVLVAGVLGAELFLSRVSLIGLVAGTIWFVFGWPHLRLLTFPLAFLFLMIPIPTILFNQIAFPLQLLASRFGEGALRVCGIPVLREGNVIVLATTTLEVAEACSGIRSLISLLTLGLVYGYFVDRRPLVRAVIALSTIPIAIVANGLRVAGTGVAAHYIGREAAQGFFHTFSGWLVFVVAFMLLLGVIRVLHRLFPPDTSPLGVA
jgi:exosortase